MQPIHRFLTFFAIVCLITATAARASDAAPNTPRTLTLEECIRLALQHNFDVRIQRYGPEIARYNLSVSYAGYEPVLALTGEHSYRLSPGGIDAENRPFVGSETEEDSVGASIRGLMPWGLSYSLGGNVGDSYGTRPGFIEVTNVVGTNIVVVEVPIRIPFENADGQIGVFEMRQPLMRNAWIDSTRLNIQIDKADLKISELALQQQIMTTVTAVENAYYNLIFAQENVRVQEAALQLAERLLAENKKRVEVGAMAPLDEKQAEAQVATSRADLLSARRTLEAQQNLLKNLLTDEYPNWHKVDLQPAEKLLAVPVSLQLYDSWHKGMTMRPDLLQFRENLAKQNIVLSFQKNQLFPQFDLVARYGYSASGDEISPALDQLTNGENPFWSYRAELNIPLGNRAARNTYKAAKASREQLVLQLRKLEQNVMVEIDDAVGTVRSSFERVEATHQASLFAEAALDAEQKKLENGKSTSFQVLQLQRDLTDARSREIRALADYNIALAQLALSEGDTLQRNRIKLDVK